MKIRSPAKLTLSLEVLGKREDGYHSIDAEMVSLDLVDWLDITEADSKSSVEVVASTKPDSTKLDSGAVGDLYIGNVGVFSKNLVVKALDYVGIPANVKIIKAIPAGAGLGGGSSNAAAILHWAKSGAKSMPKSVKELESYNLEDVAKELGADVAFCLVGGRARVSGMGEVVEPLDFKPATYTLLTPPFACSTAEIYSIWDKLNESDTTKSSIDKESGGNSLEAAALVVAPELANWRDYLAELSGKQPQLAGSGSTWFVAGKHQGTFKSTQTIVAQTLNT